MKQHIRTIMMAALIWGPASSGMAQHPFRGSLQWSVLLCDYTDSPTSPRSLTDVRDMFTRLGTDGVADYWSRASRQGIVSNRIDVRGFFRVNQTVAIATAKARWDRFNDCTAAATAGGYTPPGANGIIVMTNPGIDLWGAPGRAFAAIDHDVGAFGHEVGHGLGFNHSFSDDPTYRNASWAQIGEYGDPWDVMSYANVFGRPTARFGSSPVGHNGPHLDRIGWLPRNEIVTFGADGATSRVFTLTALHAPTPGGTRLVRIPFDPGDLFHYYTIEFRMPRALDTGIPAGIVLLHEVRRGTPGDPTNAQYFSFLMIDPTGSRPPRSSLNANGVNVSVVSIDTVAGRATVSVTGNIAQRCLQGFVWREARSTDRVCVIGATRAETRQENSLANTRRSPTGGPFGPNTCLPGFVWREAFPGDQVCVTGASRTRAASDNASASSRANPARFVFGPNTCKSQYVWREADGMDYVCVPGETRADTRQENLLASTRRSPAGGPFGPNTCLQGFVWREAFPGDQVCVTGASRARAAADNQQAASRVEKP
ncbi:MAG TPA: hypothetical protein VES88_12280 [Gemmatimonadaceae bacterium]|nr:hypothetical protein [Gemmatimonadaceae bacterium]